MPKTPRIVVAAASYTQRWLSSDETAGQRVRGPDPVSRCVVCGRKYAPGDGNTVNVLTIDGELGPASRPVRLPGLPPLAEQRDSGRRRDPPRSVVLLAERDHPVPAMLLWEPYSAAMAGDQSADAEMYRTLGLQSGVINLNQPDQPRVHTLVLRVLGTIALIELTDDGVDRVIAQQRQWLADIEEANPALAAQAPQPDADQLRDFEAIDLSGYTGEPLKRWRAHVSQTGLCVLVHGALLGLDHPSDERIHFQLAEGKAVAGIAPAKIEL